MIQRVLTVLCVLLGLTHASLAARSACSPSIRRLLSRSWNASSTWAVRLATPPIKTRRQVPPERASTLSAEAMDADAGRIHDPLTESPYVAQEPAQASALAAGAPAATPGSRCWPRRRCAA